ncbi:MAG: phosphate signaling complex protein PhoU [Acidiferrobacterales bacterium]|nr:phosphate signaling complex protein PhoU [Acidiferrobacterales bacterium]
MTRTLRWKRVRNHVLAMGGLVEQQIADALRALERNDLVLAEAVVTNDYKVNAMEVAIDEECSRILARRQPAASDLRLIVAVIKTITDLERIGDHAERVGRMAIKLGEDKQAKRSAYFEIRHMGTDVRHMLHDALDVFARLDAAAAVKVAQRDAEIDEEYGSILRELITFMMEDPRTISRGIDVVWCARLEQQKSSSGDT